MIAYSNIDFWIDETTEIHVMVDAHPDVDEMAVFVFCFTIVGIERLFDAGDVSFNQKTLMNCE
jgi:hypothetical protein